MNLFPLIVDYQQTRHLISEHDRLRTQPVEYWVWLVADRIDFFTTGKINKHLLCIIPLHIYKCGKNAWLDYTHGRAERSLDSPHVIYTTQNKFKNTRRFYMTIVNLSCRDRLTLVNERVGCSLIVCILLNSMHIRL